MNEQFICQVVEQAVKEAGRAVMTLDTAKRLIEKVEDKARDMGIAVIIAVADKEYAYWTRQPGRLPSIVWTMLILPASISH